MRKILIVFGLWLSFSSFGQNDPFTLFPVPIPDEGAYWTGDNTPNDSWPGAYNLTLNGDATYGTDKDGNSNSAFSFDGTGDYASAGDVLSFERTDKFSHFAWIYLNTLGSSVIVIGKDTSFRGYSIFIRSSNSYPNVILRNDYPNTNYLWVEHQTALSTGTWYHVGYTYDGSSNASGVKIYLNGQESSNTLTDNLSSSITNSTSLELGSRSATSRTNFDGLIDDVRIYDYVLTPEQVAHLYSKPR